MSMKYSLENKYFDPYEKYTHLEYIDAQDANVSWDYRTKLMRWQKHHLILTEEENDRYEDPKLRDVCTREVQSGRKIMLSLFDNK